MDPQLHESVPTPTARCAALGLAPNGTEASCSFAWYTAQKSATALYTNSPGEQSMTVSSNTKTGLSATSFTLAINATPINSSGWAAKAALDNPPSQKWTDDMEMVTYASTASGGKAVGHNFGYHVRGEDGNPTHYQTDQFGTNDYWRYYDVEVGLPAGATLEAADGLTYSRDTAVTMLGNVKYKVEVYAGTGSRIRFYEIADDGSTEGVDEKAVGGECANTGGTAYTSASPLTLSNASTGDGIASTSKHYYFGIYVEGENSGTADTEAPSGNFTILVADKA